MESIVCVASEQSGLYVLHSAASSTTRVLQICPFTGDVALVGAFASEDAALLHLGRHGDTLSGKRRVSAVLGLYVGAAVALLFVATKLREVLLPLGAAFVVVQSDVIELPLRLPRDDPDGDWAREAAALAKYRLQEVLYFSHQLDLTRPWGPPFAPAPRAQLQDAYVWNAALRVPFVLAGCDDVCPCVMQGYCARRRAPDFQCAMIVRRSFRASECEVDLVCWNEQRAAGLCTKRAMTPPHEQPQELFTAYFEGTARRFRDASDLLAEPLLLLLTLDADGERLARAVAAADAATRCTGTMRPCAFDWRRACKMHSGRCEDAAGEAYNLIGDGVLQLRAACVQLAPVLRVDAVQSGTLVAFSDDSLKSVSEFSLFFALAAAAELVRLIEGRHDAPAWQGLSCAPSELLPFEAAQLVASLSVEASDAQTYLFLWRESLFAGPEISSFLPTSLLISSPLHRMVGTVLSTLSEAERAVQESAMAQLRRGALGPRRVRLTQEPCGPPVLLPAGVERRLTDLRPAAVDWVVDASGAATVTLHVPLCRAAIVTHWSITFGAPVAAAPRPVACDVLFGDAVSAARLALPHALADGTALVFPLCERPWDMLDAGPRPRRAEGWDRRRAEDTRVTFVFHAPAGAAAVQLGSISVFGLVTTTTLDAADELWRLQLSHRLAVSSSSLTAPVGVDQLVPFVFGRDAPSPGSAPDAAGVADESDAEGHDAGRQYVDAARHADTDDLLALLALETRRVALRLSEGRRDALLYGAGLDVCSVDPRKLLLRRDATVQEWIRESVPSSFLQCAAGGGCRGRGVATLSVSRNKPCFQCHKRFCARCLDDTVLLESSVGRAPVCFACQRAIEGARALLAALQHSWKALAVATDAPRDIAFRHLLRLCAQVARARGDVAHYPFVRCDAAAPELRYVNLCFLPADATPATLFWCVAATDAALVVQLAVRAHVTRVTVTPPVGAQWREPVTLAVGSARAIAAPGSAALAVQCDHVGSTVALQLHCAAGLAVARIALEFSAVKSRPPLRKKDIVLHSKEVFGAAKRRAESGAVATEWPAPHAAPAVGRAAMGAALLQSLPAVRLFEPKRVDVRGAGDRYCDVWIKLRGALEYRGGFLLRPRWQSATLPSSQVTVVVVSALLADERGRVCGVTPIARVFVPLVPHCTWLWFPFERVVVASALAFEFVGRNAAPCAMPDVCLGVTE